MFLCLTSSSLAIETYQAELDEAYELDVENKQYITELENQLKSCRSNINKMKQRTKVVQQRYQDAWLIQHHVFHLLESIGVEARDKLAILVQQINTTPRLHNYFHNILSNLHNSDVIKIAKLCQRNRQTLRHGILHSSEKPTRRALETMVQTTHEIGIQTDLSLNNKDHSTNNQLSYYYMIVLVCAIVIGMFINNKTKDLDSANDDLSTTELSYSSDPLQELRRIFTNVTP